MFCLSSEKKVKINSFNQALNVKCENNEKNVAHQIK